MRYREPNAAPLRGPARTGAAPTRGPAGSVGRGPFPVGRVRYLRGSGTVPERVRLTAPNGGEGALPRRPLLRQPVFGRLWAGSVASSIGSSAGFLAITWLVYVETGSAFDVALLGVAGLVPRATFGLFSGVLADRFPRLRLMILADAFRAVTMVAFAASLFLFGFALWAVLTVVAVLGIGQSLFRPALSAFLPTTVVPEELGAANGLLSVAQEVTATIGSPLGGILIGLIGIAATLAVNGASYAISGLLIVAVSLTLNAHRAVPARPPSSPPPFLRQFREGLEYVRGQRALLKLTLASFGANFFLSLFFTFLVVYVGSVLHENAIVFGLLSAGAAAGFGVGSLLVSRLRSERRFGVWFATGWGIAGVGILGVVLVPVPLAVGLLLFVIGVGGGFGNTTFFTGVQRVVPNELLGRYLSLDEVGSIAASPAGQLGGGLIISAAGIALDFSLASVGTALFSFGLLLFADVRALRS